MKRIVVSSIVISLNLIFSQSFAEDTLNRDSSNDKLIEETIEQEKVIDSANGKPVEAIQAQEKAVDTANEEAKIEESTVEGQTEETKCEEKLVQIISISNSSIHSIDTDFNQITESTGKKIAEIAEELGLKDFDVTMTDQYASRNGYSTDTYDYSASFSLTFQFDKKAFGTFLKKLSPINISSSINKQECG